MKGEAAVETPGEELSPEELEAVMEVLGTAAMGLMEQIAQIFGISCFIWLFQTFWNPPPSAAFLPPWAGARFNRAELKSFPTVLLGRTDRQETVASTQEAPTEAPEKAEAVTAQPEKSSQEGETSAVKGEAAVETPGEELSPEELPYASGFIIFITFATISEFITLRMAALSSAVSAFSTLAARFKSFSSSSDVAAALGFIAANVLA